jgi:membrane dipeptidase
MADNEQFDKRRRTLLMAGAAVGASLAMPMINSKRYQLFAGDQTRYSQRAIELLEGSVVIDMLNPVGAMSGRFKRWMDDPTSFSEEDMAWLKSSGINVFHSAMGNRGWQAYQRSRDLFAGWNTLIVNNGDHLMRMDSASDLHNIVASGKVGVIYGEQNSDHFRTTEDIAEFHRLGQRVSQLTYNWQNHLGSGPLEKTDPGLSLFGVSVVEEMNRVGMTVDVSHCADQTTLDAFEASSKPVAVTHSNCRSLNPGYMRCKTDEAIIKMAKTGGVMGVTTLRAFVRDEDPVTVEHVIDHIDHIVKLTGIEHAGIGSDADLDAYGEKGMEDYLTSPPHVQELYRFRETIDIIGLDHPKRMYDLTEALIRRGYSDENIELLIGGNFARMLAETWKAAPPAEEKDKQDA